MTAEEREPRIVESGPIHIKLKLSDVMQEFAKQVAIARLRQAAKALNDKQEGEDN